MISKALLAVSAIVMGVVGLIINFAPDKAAVALGLGGQPPAELIIQIIAALYLAMAVLNWMSKAQTMGGIYNKPLALANALHFTVGAFALVRYLAGEATSSALLFAAIAYVVFALGFLWIVFLSPSPVGAETAKI